MIRLLIKQTIAVLIYYTGFLHLYSFIRRRLSPYGNMTILAYHRILANDEAIMANTQPGMCVIEDSFKGQMAYLHNHYRFVSLDTLVSSIKGGRVFSDKVIVVTFDDGWKDNFDYAYPILKQFGIPATIFLPTDIIESNRLPCFLEISLLLGQTDLWPKKAVEIFKNVVKEFNLTNTIEGLDEYRLSIIKGDPSLWMRALMLLDYRYHEIILERMKMTAGFDIDSWDNIRWMLNWDEIVEMNQNNIDFGSHGKSHDIMIHMEAEKIEQELRESKNIIEKHLDKPIESLSYPNNDYNAEIKALVQQAGYQCAVNGTGRLSNEIHPDLFALRRYNMNEGAAIGPNGKFSKAIFACYIERLF